MPDLSKLGVTMADADGDADPVAAATRIAHRWAIGCESLGIVHDEETWEEADEWRWSEGVRRYPGVRLDLMEIGMAVPRV